jgi:hypothetical protein
MREIRPSGLEGGGADTRSPYPYRLSSNSGVCGVLSFSGCGFKDCFGMERCDAQEHLGGSAGGAAALFAVVQGANTDAQCPPNGSPGRR